MALTDQVSAAFAALTGQVKRSQIKTTFRPQTGAFMLPSHVVTIGSSVATLTTCLDLAPFDIGYPLPIQALCINVTTAQAGGTIACTLALYADDGTGLPDVVNGLLEQGTVTLTATGRKDVTVARTLQPGRYWAGVLFNQSAAPTTPPQFTSISGSLMLPIPSASALTSVARTLRVSTTTLPTSTPTWTFGTTSICPYLRRA